VAVPPRTCQLLASSFVWCATCCLLQPACWICSLLRSDCAVVKPVVCSAATHIITDTVLHWPPVMPVAARAACSRARPGADSRAAPARRSTYTHERAYAGRDSHFSVCALEPHNAARVDPCAMDPPGAPTPTPPPTAHGPRPHICTHARRTPHILPWYSGRSGQRDSGDMCASRGGRVRFGGRAEYTGTGDRGGVGRGRVRPPSAQKARGTSLSCATVRSGGPFLAANVSVLALLPWR